MSYRRDSETTQTSMQTARARAEMQALRKQQLASSIKARDSGGGTFKTFLFLVGLVAAIAFGAHRFGVLGKMFAAVGLVEREAAVESVAQKQFKIQKKQIAPQPAPQLAPQPTPRAAAAPDAPPVYAFGDEFVYQHVAVNGQGIKVVQESVRYAVQGMLGDRVSWNVADQVTRTTAANPFLGDIEDFESAANSPRFVGDSASFFPLRVGGRMQLTRAGDSAETYVCEVKGGGRLRVPAGEFDTTRVDCQTTGGARYRAESFHYASQVGYWIQRQTRSKVGEHERVDTYSLTSFKRAPAAYFKMK